MSSFSQIVGADGRFYSPEEARLVFILDGIEDGSAAGPEFYQVGASLLSNLNLGRTIAPALATRANNVLGANAIRMATQVRQQPDFSRAIREAMPELAASIRASQPHVAPASAGELREVVQGLDSGTILVAPGATFIISFNASMLFRPTRLMVGPSVAPWWSIEDIKVAADSLFLQTGPVPAEVYLPNGVGASALKRRTAMPGTPVQVVVTNNDVAPHRFRGALFGAAADASSCA